MEKKNKMGKFRKHLFILISRTGSGFKNNSFRRIDTAKHPGGAKENVIFLDPFFTVVAAWESCDA
jgi:hypothetical protein